MCRLVLQIEDAQCCAVFKVSHLLSVGAELGLERRCLVVCEPFFLDSGGVGEHLFVLFGERRAVNLPQAVAFGGVDKASSVGRKAEAPFLFGGIRHFLCRSVVGCCYEYIAVQDEGYFLSFGRHGDFCSSVCPYLPDDVLFALVGDDADFKLFRLLSLFQRIDFPVVAVAERAVVCCGKKAYRMFGMMRQLLFPASVDVASVYVERPALFAQIIERLAVGAPYGCAVFAVEVGEPGV